MAARRSPNPPRKSSHLRLLAGSPRAKPRGKQRGHAAVRLAAVRHKARRHPRSVGKKGAHVRACATTAIKTKTNVEVGVERDAPRPKPLIVTNRVSVRQKRVYLSLRSAPAGRFVLSSPIVIHLHRPYASEEEYIAHERFSIEAKSMLLIDQPALPFDTAVVFDVTLDNGQKPIRAEARVIGYVEAEGDRPAGLRVRFRRFGAATKAFIDRAVNGTSAPASASQPSVAPLPGAAAAQAGVSAPDADAPSRSDVRTQTAPNTTPLVTSSSSAAHETNDADETSGIHKKTGAPSIVAPANRDALLARLRGRRVS